MAPPKTTGKKNEATAVVMIWIWAGGRVAAGCLANVLQKRLANAGHAPLPLTIASLLWLAVLALPWALGVLPCSWPASFWQALLIAAVFELPGNVLLVASLQQTDLSLFGPLNAFKPLVALGGAVCLTGEWPRSGQLVGMGVILLGTLVLTSAPTRKDTQRGKDAGVAQAGRSPSSPGDYPVGTGLWSRGVAYRLVGILFSALGAVFLKQATLAATATTAFLGWAMLNVPLGFVVLGLAAPSARAACIGLMRRPPPMLLLLAGAFLLLQWLTLEVFARLPVAVALAVFQSSMVVSVLLGWRLFAEPRVGRRLGASVVMLAGVGLVLGT